MRSTRTFVTLEVSEEAYTEIADKLRAAEGYAHAFMPGGEIDMHGIALEKGPARKASDEQPSQKAEE